MYLLNLVHVNVIESVLPNVQPDKCNRVLNLVLPKVQPELITNTFTCTVYFHVQLYQSSRMVQVPVPYSFLRYSCRLQVPMIVINLNLVELYTCISLEGADTKFSRSKEAPKLF